MFLWRVLLSFWEILCIVCGTLVFVCRFGFGKTPKFGMRLSDTQLPLKIIGRRPVSSCLSNKLNRLTLATFDEEGMYEFLIQPPRFFISALSWPLARPLQMLLRHLFLGAKPYSLCTTRRAVIARCYTCFGCIELFRIWKYYGSKFFGKFSR